MIAENWDIRRKGRKWSDDEFELRLAQAPEKIEWDDGIFNDDQERLVVLGMLLENLGVDKVVQFGKLEDWKAAVSAREGRHRAVDQS